MNFSAWIVLVSMFEIWFDSFFKHIIMTALSSLFHIVAPFWPWQPGLKVQANAQTIQDPSTQLLILSVLPTIFAFFAS